MILKREIGENTEIPADKYLSDVLMVGIARGKAPTSTEYEKLGRFSETSGRRKFGTWDNTLGVLCAELFKMRVPLDYMVRASKEVKENKDGDIRKKTVEKNKNIRIHPMEWKLIKEEIGIEEKKNEPIEKEKALEDYRKYKENWSTKSNNRFFISTMSDILKTPPKEYIKYYTNMKTADRMIGEREIYPTNIGRGRREKLDEFLKIADMATVEMRNDVPGGARKSNYIVKRIEEYLPEKFK